jgi:ribosomal protein S27AE
MKTIGKSGTSVFSFRMFTLKDHQALKELEQNMVDKLKVKERIARGDGSVAPHHLSGEAPPADTGRVDGEGKVKPHDRESEVATSIELEKLICPRCGKPTLHAEFPDHYEAWTKCSDCGFFMGMSNEDWHRMESSSNLSEKIRKMALKRELVKS